MTLAYSRHQYAEIVLNQKSATWFECHRHAFEFFGDVVSRVIIDNAKCAISNAYYHDKENLEFIQQCEKSLSAGCFVKNIRIDAAGYQTRIIKYCDQAQIGYAIRAKMSGPLRELITSIKQADWQPLYDRKGKEISGHSSYRTLHTIGDYDQAFTVVIQRKRMKGQLDLEILQSDEEIFAQGYVYRAIATNREWMSNSEVIHWYKQRAEDSENRIKELKRDFAADTLPCSDFKANALYFSICTLVYNLYALMRQLLPEGMETSRAKIIRWPFADACIQWRPRSSKQADRSLLRCRLSIKPCWRRWPLPCASFNRRKTSLPLTTSRQDQPWSNRCALYSSNHGSWPNK